MKSTVGICVALVVASLCIATRGAIADELVVLPDATFSGDWQASAASDAPGVLPGGGGGEGTGSTSYRGPLQNKNVSVSAPLGSSAQVLLTDTGLIYPLVDVVVNETTPAVSCEGCSNIASAEADANLVYSFEIVGSSGNVPILIRAAGGLLTNGEGGNFVGLAELGIGGPGLNILDQVWIGAKPEGNAELFCSQSGCTGTMKEDSVFSLQTNQQYDVELSVSVSVSGCSADDDANPNCTNDTYKGVGILTEPPRSAYAYVDPYFSIAPGTPDADQYSIVLSRGVGNALPSAVPEPSTWAMMLAGFGGLAFAGYRARHTRVSGAGSNF